MRPKAHVSEEKKKELASIVKLMQEYPVVGLIDLTGLPSAQYQSIRAKLKSRLLIKTANKNLIRLALEKIKENKHGIEEFEPLLKDCMPALLFTKEDPFIISKNLNKSKSKAAAKPGQIAPYDLIAPAGPTPFAPGPIIGELGAVGIKTQIVAGKIHIKEDAVLAHKGDVINQKVAEMLARLGIQPMEIGLNLAAMYDSGKIFLRDVLSINEQDYINQIKEAFAFSLNLAVYSAYTSKDTINHLIKKSVVEGKALSSYLKLEISEEIKHIEHKEYHQPPEKKENVKEHVKEDIHEVKEESVSQIIEENLEENKEIDISPEEKVAQGILRDLQDKKLGINPKHKHKKEVKQERIEPVDDEKVAQNILKDLQDKKLGIKHKDKKQENKKTGLEQTEGDVTEEGKIAHDVLKHLQDQKIKEGKF